MAEIVCLIGVSGRATPGRGDGGVRHLAGLEAVVEAGVGILEDDLHVTTRRPQLPLRHGEDILPLKLHSPRGRLQKPENSLDTSSIGTRLFLYLLGRLPQCSSLVSSQPYIRGIRPCALGSSQLPWCHVDVPPCGAMPVTVTKLLLQREKDWLA